MSYRVTSFLVCAFFYSETRAFLSDGLTGALIGGTPDPLLHCDLRPADIMFLLDSSGSEGPTHFREQLQFVYNFVNAFDIGEKHVQFGVLTFASNIYNHFDMNTYKNKSTLLDAIKRIPYSSGGTNTASALQYVVHNSFTPARGDRGPVTDVLIVLTDGHSYNPQSTKQEAELAHNKGIKTFAIGIGNMISKDELNSIASDTQHVFHVSTFEALHTLQNALRNKTCEAIGYSQLYCQNHLSNCASYGHGMCSSYAAWGRDNCALYCGYCAAQGGPPSHTVQPTTVTTNPTVSSPSTHNYGPCLDAIPNCDGYGLSTCTQYREWADQNCPRFCGFCQGPPTPPPLTTTPSTTMPPSTTTTSPTTTITPSPTTKTTISPTSSTAVNIVYDKCEDKVGSCERYGPQICFQYSSWAAVQCPKFCLFCRETTTHTPTTTPVCADRNTQCLAQGPGACNNRTWAEVECRAFCLVCTAIPDKPTTAETTTLATTPADLVPTPVSNGPCEDAITNCHSFGLSVCTNYHIWADKNCPRYCMFCKDPLNATDPSIGCRSRPVDIAFVIDSSGSVGMAHFTQLLQFTDTFVDEFDVGPENAKVGVVTFSSNINNWFSFSNFSDKASVQQAIHQLPYISGTTNTALALQFTLQTVFESRAGGNRNTEPDVMILLTDGHTLKFDFQQILKQASFIHDAGINLLVIGIGSGVTDDEITKTASNPSFGFRSQSFDDLSTLKDKLLNITCTVSAKPITDVNESTTAAPISTHMISKPVQSPNTGNPLSSGFGRRRR